MISGSRAPHFSDDTKDFHFSQDATSSPHVIPTSLRLLEPAMRLTMTNKRLSGLAMMSVHRNLASCLDVRDWWTRLAATHARRMHLHALSASKDNFA